MSLIYVEGDAVKFVGKVPVQDYNTSIQIEVVTKRWQKQCSCQKNFVDTEISKLKYDVQERVWFQIEPHLILTFVIMEVLYDWM